MAVEIADWNDLDNVRNDLTDDYVLVNDLDSETDGYAGIGDDFEPIGPELFDDNFLGSFDGQGNEIGDLVVSINQEGVGLFTGLGRGGDGTELIENLSVSGSVTNTGEERYVGGVAGRVDNGTIQNCASHVDVTAPDGEQVGGLVGSNGDTVTESYATGSVEGDGSVGGLVGNLAGPLTESYATGSVEGDSNVGGLVGNEAFGGETSDSYWDTEATGQSTSDGGTGLTTSEMQGSEAETNMDGFDFANVWDSVLESDGDTTADGYPILIALDRENQLEAQGILVLFDLTVETNPATNISEFSATLNGELVELDDEAEDADVFFEFGENVGDSQTPIQTLTGPATFDELIDELEPNTTFEFRAVAEAQDADDETFTDEGDILTFDTEIVTLDGTISLDEVGVENADVLVYNFTRDVFEGRLNTDVNGNYDVNLPEANRLDTVVVAVDFDDGTERYGRLVTTVLE